MEIPARRIRLKDVSGARQQNAKRALGSLFRHLDDRVDPPEPNPDIEGPYLRGEPGYRKVFCDWEGT